MNHITSPDTSDSAIEREIQAKGKTALATVVDHIKPLALGGDDSDENTRNLCDPCHDDVTAEQFGYRKRVEIGLDGWPT